MTTDADLTSILTQRQAELGLNDQEFAAHLGISRQMWSALKTGITPFGRRSLERVLAKYPDLREMVAELLSAPSNAKKLAV